METNSKLYIDIKLDWVVPKSGQQRMKFVGLFQAILLHELTKIKM